MSSHESPTLTAGGGRRKKKGDIVATANTPAGQKRQVWEGKADVTKSGLRKKDLTQAKLKKGQKTRQIVSKARNQNGKVLSEWIKVTSAARKNQAPTLQYNGKTYYSKTTKTGLTTYSTTRRSSRSPSPKRKKSSPKRKKSSPRRKSGSRKKRRVAGGGAATVPASVVPGTAQVL